MYWFWSGIYTTLYHVKSQNCMIMMYSLHSTHSPCHICWQRPHRRCLDGYHVDSANCCLIGIVLGVKTKKISPNNYTTQYLQILPSTQSPSASIVLTLLLTCSNYICHSFYVDKVDKWTWCCVQCQMSMSKTFIGCAVCGEFESEPRRCRRQKKC